MKVKDLPVVCCSKGLEREDSENRRGLLSISYRGIVRKEGPGGEYQPGYLPHATLAAVPWQRSTDMPLPCNPTVRTVDTSVQILIALGDTIDHSG